MARTRTTLGKITRRAFMVGSAAVAGGVAFVGWQATRTLANPLMPDPGAFTLNPFILIDASGITIVVPRAEMGQGVHTTLAALVAEELDADFAAIKVIHGPGAQAYYNGAVMGGALPWPDYAMTGFQERIKGLTSVLPKMMALQVTGGSTSAVDAFDKMRMAGATARETLKLAAAQRLNVMVDTLKTDAGAVIGPDGTRLPYSELAEAAAQIPPQEATLRPASDWKLLGKSQPRTDMVAKATGTAAFGIDTRLPDMRYATVRMSPRRGAMIRFDASQARKMEGVEEVLDLGTGVAVIASNTWFALQAAQAVQIEWADAPYPADTAAIFARIEAAFADAPNSTMRDDGDVDAQQMTLEAEYRVPYLAHATMEPMNATAYLQNDHLTLWCGNQIPIVTAQKCAEAADMPVENVTVHTTFLGGGFGRRGEFDFSVLAARIAAALPNVPIQLTYSREEDMTHDFYRPGAIARFKGAVANGKAVSLSASIAAPSVARQATQRIAGFATPGPDKAMVEGLYDQPYAIPHYRVQGHIADVALPVGFWRSVGASHNGFFHESFIDELAHAAGADPLQFRVDHVRPAHEPSAKLLEAVGEMSGWGGARVPGVGRGVALSYSFGTPVAQVIEVQDQAGDIRITRAWIAVDPGVALDPAIITAQMTSGLIYGLSAAVMGEITVADGMVEQQNFWDYNALRIHTVPVVDVRILQNNGHIGGVGEPGTPPAAPALANALFDLTGKRARELPLAKTFSFVS